MGPAVEARAVVSCQGLWLLFCDFRELSRKRVITKKNYLDGRSCHSKQSYFCCCYRNDNGRKGRGKLLCCDLDHCQCTHARGSDNRPVYSFSASVAAMVVFQKNKSVSWGLALLIGTCTAVSALGGGYFSHLFSGFLLKLVFAAMLVGAGIVMLIPVSENKGRPKNKHIGVITIRSGDETYSVNLWIALPIAVLTGFGSGMVGVSGGSFLVPLMVLACGVSMHTAVGTASTLIAATALMGFTGHALQGDFNPSWAVPLHST